MNLTFISPFVLLSFLFLSCQAQQPNTLVASNRQSDISTHEPAPASKTALEIRTFADTKVIATLPVTIICRVVDAADGQPLEGVPVPTSGRGFVETDADGRVTLQRDGAYIDSVVRVTIIEKPVELKKHGVVIDSSRVVIPAAAYGPRLTKDLPQPVELEIRLDLAGKMYTGKVAATNHAQWPERQFQSVLETARIVVESNTSSKGFPVRFGGETTIGPVSQTLEPPLAYLFMGGKAKPFTLTENFDVTLDYDSLPSSFTIQYVNAFPLQYIAVPGYSGFSDVTAIRLSDAVIIQNSTKTDIMTNQPMTGYSAQFFIWDEGEFAIIPGRFADHRWLGGHPYHFTVIRAIREGIDLRQFGIPVITMKPGEPTQTVHLDGLAFIEAIPKIQQALREKADREVQLKPEVAPPPVKHK